MVRFIGVNLYKFTFYKNVQVCQTLSLEENTNWRGRIARQPIHQRAHYSPRDHCHRDHATLPIDSRRHPENSF